MIYLDASVALAQLLAEDRAPKIDKSLLATGEPQANSLKRASAFACEAKPGSRPF